MDIKLISEDIKFKYRVSAIIINEGKILVDKYDNNRFCLPGGYVEVGETSLEALKREIFEEIQIKVTKAEYTGIIENFFTNYKGVQTHGLDFYYTIYDEEATNIDMNYIEYDKNGIINHCFSWIPIKSLQQFEIVPSKIIDIIINKEKDFHYIIDEIK